MLFDATSASHPEAISKALCPSSTSSHNTSHLAGTLLPYSISGTENPFCHISFRRCVEETVPRFLEVPSSGFGYPLDGLSRPFLGSLFQPPTLMGFALQSFSLSSWSKNSFEFSSPFLRLSRRPNGPPTCASTVCSHNKSRTPFSHPEELVQVGALALLGILDLSGSPSSSIYPKSIYLFEFPSRSSFRSISQSIVHGTSRV